jgi:hypothetical protein
LFKGFFPETGRGFQFAISGLTPEIKDASLSQPEPFEHGSALIEERLVTVLSHEA